MAAKLAWRSEEEMFPPSAAPAAVSADGLPMGIRVNGKEDERGEVTGVFKGRVDEKLRVGVVWEGRVKDLLVCVGSTLDLRRRDQPFRSLGVELQYSS